MLKRNRSVRLNESRCFFDHLRVYAPCSKVINGRLKSNSSRATLQWCSKLKIRKLVLLVGLSYELLFRGSSFALRYSSPSGPIAVTCVTYSPDFAQWKWGVSPGRMITAPGG